MTKKEIQNRNWQKARLSGFCLDYSVLTKKEYDIYVQITVLKKQMLDGWDSEYEKLLGHSLKPYKCIICGRRGDRNYILNNKNFCYKHYNYFKTI